ncbi:hypothetical protein [Streptomyces sp. NPDC007100]|uniref:hypothetical protein n=1 Tax=Streptomyces sp. NPDC007100 TaxID=3155602 RepID=UPI0033EC74B3
MKRYESKWTKTHPGGLVTFGATEPVLTVLDVAGFELRDLFLIGISDDCGTIIVADESRARAAAAALEPAFKSIVGPFPRSGGDWSVEYTLRDRDGTAPSRFVTDITLTDGTAVMRNGRRA